MLPMSKYNNHMRVESACNRERHDQVQTQKRLVIIEEEMITDPPKLLPTARNDMELIVQKQQQNKCPQSRLFQPQ